MLKEDRKGASEEMERLRRTQSELEAVLSKSRADRESEEMQAHEAMNIVAAEMTAVRNECSNLEDQLAEMRMVMHTNFLCLNSSASVSSQDLC